MLHTLIGHTADVICAAFSPDGRRLATASFDRTIKLWDTATGRDVFTLRGHTAGVVALAFSPDGNRLVSGGIDNTARVWDATPLPAEILRADDDRYRRKIATLEQLKGAEDDARAGQDPGQWRPVGHGGRVARQSDREGTQTRSSSAACSSMRSAGGRSKPGWARLRRHPQAVRE